MSVPFLTGLNSVDGDKRGTPGANARGKPLIQICGWIRRAQGGEMNQVRNRCFSVLQGKPKALSNNASPLGLHEVNRGSESVPGMWDILCGS